ncbi:MAG: WcaI family glycosyltransferase [Novosphingobium sp.]
MRLLVLGLNYAPEPVGIGPYTAQMCEGLVRRGHEVAVVTARPYYPWWQAHPDHRRRGWSRSVESGVEVTRCPHYIPARPTGARRIAHHVTFALAALPAMLGAAWRRRPDVVLCVAPSLLSVAVAWLVARLSGARLWVHVQDFEVDVAFATGLVRSPKLAARIAAAIESRLLRLGDRVSTIGPQMAERLVAKEVRAARVRELRNWASAPAEVAGASDRAYRAEWRLGDAAVALYSGNIANKQGLEVVVEAAARLTHRDDLVFVICGDGPNRQRLEALSKGVANVRLRALQPAERLGELLALARIHLLPQIAGAADLVLPSKLANMLASGRPVVATAAAGSGLAGEIAGCGIAVPPGDADALAGAIEALLDDPAHARRLGAAGRERARERWGREAILDRLASELADLAAPSEQTAMLGDAAR